MQVRVFEATDMASGLKMVKKELGPDALILSTRTVRAGKLGLLGKPMLEITAAIDTPYADKKAEQRQPASAAPFGEGHGNNGRRQEQGAAAGPSSLRSVVDDSLDEQGSKGLFFQGYGPAGRMPAESAPVFRLAPLDTPPQLHQGADSSPDKPEPGLQNEVNELKDLVKSLAGRIALMNEQETARPALSPRQLSVRSGKNGARYHNAAIHGDRPLSLLVERGVNVETARTIAGFLRESLTERELGSEEVVVAAITDTIRDLFQVDPPFSGNPAEPLRIALVGPTGVGKTTTLAKIAASYLGRQSRSVAMITIDTYRIAAVEQLKVYGEIMDLPVEVVITPEQLQQALERHRDKELILIDTAGRSPRDSMSIEELCLFFPAQQNIDKHLVLSATTREQELLDAIERFRPLGITHTIYTKIDECATLGAVLNVQLQNPSPLSFFANGQRVPEDLMTATAKLAAELIMNPQQGSMHD